MFFARGVEIDCMRAETNLLLCGDPLTSFYCGLSKLGWFLDAGRKSLGFSVSIEIDLVFVWVVKIDLISLRDRPFTNEQKRCGL